MQTALIEVVLEKNLLWKVYIFHVATDAQRRKPRFAQRVFCVIDNEERTTVNCYFSILITFYT